MVVWTSQRWSKDLYFAENIPVVSLPMSMWTMNCHIILYGGMQDNRLLGWAFLISGEDDGISEYYWQEISFGRCFPMWFPDPTEFPIWLYYVSRCVMYPDLIRKRVHNKTVRPTHSDQDVSFGFKLETPPLRRILIMAKTVIMVLQFLMKSTDNGDYLGNISPKDLTHKNDTTKQPTAINWRIKLLIHWSWKSYEPFWPLLLPNRSEINLGRTMWYVQVTKDGGKTWTMFSFQTSKVCRMGSWVPPDFRLHLYGCKMKRG